MTGKTNKISIQWIRETRNSFGEFLDETHVPDAERLSERGPRFKYPEWLNKFIAILTIKLKIKTYVKIHKTAVKTKHRKKMIEFMRFPKHKKIYRERFYKVELMQGLVRIYSICTDAG